MVAAAPARGVMTAPPTPQYEGLLDFAATCVPGLDRPAWRGAMLAAQTAGWPWPRTAVTTLRLILQGEEPRDLRNACADPTKPRRAR